MFVLFDENEFFISGKFTSGKGKKTRVTPEFSKDEKEAIKFKDDIAVYEYFESETRGNQILKSYSKKELKGEENV